MFAPPVKKFNDPDLGRIIFFHLPCAILSSILMAMAGWYGFQFLRTSKAKFDIRCSATWELASLFSLLTMVTGMIFSQVQWGTYWHSDPRQISFLMVLLILSAGLVLRSAFGDQDKRAKAGAGYAAAAVLPLIFLIFVFPRLPQVADKSLHPTTAYKEFDPIYTTGLLLSFAAIGLATGLIYARRIRAEELENTLRNHHANLETHRHAPADPPRVRPVSVPTDGQQ